MQRAVAFTPDGCCLDADGRLWAADLTKRRLVLIEAGGAVVDEVLAPEGLRFVACMLGGEDGRTMLACAAVVGQDYVSKQASLFTFRVNVPHAGLP
jgi:sugar lactone lactonase YvrE